MSTSGSDSNKLKMNLMIQNLLLTAMGTCKFVMQHKNHFLNQAIEQFNLIGRDHIDGLIETIKNTSPGRYLTISTDDQILIYTVMDITCKVYLTDLGDKLASVNAPALESSKSSFEEIRSTVLKGCEFVMVGMRETLAGNPAFEDRVEILDNYLIV